MRYNSSLHEKLENHYERFNIMNGTPDPIEFPHRFSYRHDIELSAFISSVFAYGSIKQIKTSLDKLHLIMGKNPYDFVSSYNQKRDSKFFKDLKHRFYSTDDITKLFYTLSKVIKKEGSLRDHFYSIYKKNESIKDSIHHFSASLVEYSSEEKIVSNGIKFMFPDPLKGSAAKRMNLFLRWMVRKDKIDFGLWNEIPTSELIIPVDTHVAKICKELRLTKLKNVSWKMAEEITNNLKKFNAIDPVKYDFSICHIGMLKLKF